MFFRIIIDAYRDDVDRICGKDVVNQTEMTLPSLPI